MWLNFTKGNEVYIRETAIFNARSAFSLYERFHKYPLLLVTHNLIEFQERKRKRSTQKSENFHKVAKIGFDFQSCREWNVTQFFFPVLHRLSREAKSPQANGAVPPPKILLSKKFSKCPHGIYQFLPRARSEIQLKSNWNSAPWRAGVGDGRGARLITFSLKEQWSKRFFAFFAGGGARYKVVNCESRGGIFVCKKCEKMKFFQLKIEILTTQLNWSRGHAHATRNTQHATRNTQHATRKNHPKSPFQRLEPLSQVLNKLGRNKKLNPSLALSRKSRYGSLPNLEKVIMVLKAVKPHS